jgi:hypothetical protein
MSDAELRNRVTTLERPEVKDVDAGTTTRRRIVPKYFTGTTAAGTTAVTHGLDATKIMHVSVSVYDGTNSVYRVLDHRMSNVAAIQFEIYYTTTAIVIGSLGTQMHNQTYVIKVDYIDD